MHGSLLGHEKFSCSFCIAFFFMCFYTLHIVVVSEHKCRLLPMLQTAAGNYNS